MTTSLKTIVVVEPHADDAFLSMGQHIEEWVKQGRRVIIETVFSGTRKRATDAINYANAVGAFWQGLGWVEGEFNDRHDFKIDTSRFSPHEYTLVIPLGIQHEEHQLVHQKYLHYLGDLWYYLDQPYAIIQKNGLEVTEKLKGMEVRSYRKPGKRKYRHIPLFKDQAKFFHFNGVDKLLQTCELVVSGPSHEGYYD